MDNQSLVASVCQQFHNNRLVQLSSYFPLPIVVVFILFLLAHYANIVKIPSKRKCIYDETLDIYGIIKSLLRN
jgi:hypothetical protein